MKKKSPSKPNISRYLIIGLALFAIICLLIWLLGSRQQRHSEVFRNSDTLLKNLYTVGADAIISPSAEEVEALYALYEKNMSADAAENLMVNRTPYRISAAVRDANGITRYLSAVYEMEGTTRYIDAVYEKEGGDSIQYKYVAAVVLAVNGEEWEIYPTGKIRLNSNGTVTGFSEVDGIERLIDGIT